MGSCRWLVAPMPNRLAPPPAIFNLAQCCLQHNAAARPGQTAMILARPASDGLGFEPEIWSFGDFEAAVLRMAAGLADLPGLTRGDRLMLRLENGSDYALLFFAAIAAGLVPLPSSSQLTAAEARFLLEDSGARAIAMADGLALDEVPTGVVVLTPVDIVTLRDDDRSATYAETAADDPAFLIYTSGTTGRPKGVLHAQRSAWGRQPMHDGWMGLTEGDVMLHSGRFNWTYTLGAGLVDPWIRGATAVLYDGPHDPSVWPRLIETYKATLFASVPGIYRQVLKYCTISDFDLSSLRHALVSGEAMAASLRAAWQSETGLEMYEALGMSEYSTYVSSSPNVPVRVGSPGKPQAGRKLAILPIDAAEGDDPLPADAVGLLGVHRDEAGLMLGYWQRPEEDALVYRGEWFCGGDLAALDDDGYLWYHGRNDDLMNASGYRVSPLEVDRVLSAHAGIGEIAVTEVHLSDQLSIICAFIVASDPARTAPADAAAILAYAAENLARYKCPREVVFVDTLPRTANGKIRRRGLQAMYPDPHASHL